MLIRLLGGQCGGELLVDAGFRFKSPPREGIEVGEGVYFGRNIEARMLEQWAGL